ncbi:hypothetical protein [Mucilaginibacter flavus]|uniref:hypothetical protein n=1 Tax=Mucilaginibacter flavus TaxID=931504 RepID=UPI0025B3BB08|nr:hypothetical protein [Mucilaginibacter flavus]MDN3583912.1 hypothetical protein [Mucilaginibacter flavus]
MKQHPDHITCYPETKIYLFCPAGYATGGPEALHQLGEQLKLMGFNALMYYYATPDSVDIVHKNYEKYQVPVVDMVENEAHHIIVLPETHLYPIFEDSYKQIRKVIWWLSVVNYHITQKGLLDSFKHKKFFKLKNSLGLFPTASFGRLKRRRDVWHISHSYYSQVHLQEQGINPVGRISDYMNSAFFDSVDENTPKESIVIYNPVKNDGFLEQIISLTPTLNWVPIKNMTPAQVAAAMNKAKLYVDFGFHPGKERMPREACIMRCCMIIGKNGSAAYAEDMPIPERYRFNKKDDQIPAIIARINECLENYDNLVTDFEFYRKALYIERTDFEIAVKKVFIKA